MLTVLTAGLIGVVIASLAATLVPLFVVLRDLARTANDTDAEWRDLLAVIDAARCDLGGGDFVRWQAEVDS